MTSTYDRRKFLAHSAAAVGGVAVAGAFADQLAAGPAGAVTKGGTLKVGVISEQHKPFTPDYANMDTSGFMYGRAVYDPLCVVSADGKTVYPYLAKSVTPNAGFNQWTIAARTGVKFHDGTPCNGHAIYQNLQADFTSSLTGAALKALIASITYDAVHDAVVVHTKYKWTSFPYTLSEQQIGFIGAPSTLGQNYKGNPIGTGPFVFNSWPYGTKFACTRNPSYWRAGLPYLDAIEFHPIPDGAVRMQALKDGNLDLIHEAQGDQLKLFPSLGGGYTYVTDVGVRPVYSPSSNCIMMNVKKAPFNDANFRKACAMAIDKATFVAVIDKGQSTPVDGIYLPGSPYYNKPPYPKYSVSQAKATLAKSKVSKANRKFTLTCVNSPIVEQSATLIQTFLSQIGVSVSITAVTQATLIGDAIFGQYQAMTWSQFGGVSPDTNYPWFSTKTGLNFANNLDSKIEAAMIAGMAASTTAARVKSWSFVNDQIDRDIPYMWTSRTIWGIAAHSNVQNWKTFTEPSGKSVLQPNQGVLFFTETWKS